MFWLRGALGVCVRARLILVIDGLNGRAGRSSRRATELGPIREDTFFLFFQFC